MTCLNTSTTGTDASDDPIKQKINKYTGFKSMAIPRGIAPLSSTIGTMYKNINLIYSK